MKAMRLREFSGVTLLYTVMTMVLTYPAIARFSTHFMCTEGDAFQNVWNIWWLKTALTELHSNPYFTRYLHYPQGHTLLFQTFNPFNGLISIPLQFLFKMEVVYNLIVFFSFVASGLGMHLLAKYLTGSRAAAFVAGVIYTFCPYHFAHGQGHLQLIAMEWLPFYLLYLFKACRENKRSNIVIAALFLVLTALCDWYYLIYAFTFTGIFVVWRFLFQRTDLLDSGFLKRLIVVFLIFFILMSPLLGSMVYTKLTQKIAGEHDPEEFSADLTSFFVPSAISTWGRMWFGNIWSKWTGNTAENTNFVGYTVLVLALYAVLRIPISRFWGATGLIAAIMALGPHLHILGKRTAIVLPYRVAHEFVPFFSFTGCPSRFDIMLMICLAILSAYTVSEIMRSRSGKDPGEKPGWVLSGKRGAFVSLVGIVICAEYLAVPYASTKVNVPQFYYEMEKDREPYAVIDFPSTERTLYYATIHKKPIIDGYVSRPSQDAVDFLMETPVVSTLICNKAISPQYANPEGVKVLEKLNVRYIIAWNDRNRDLLEKVLRLKTVYSREGIKVYDCGTLFQNSAETSASSHTNTWASIHGKVSPVAEFLPTVANTSSSLFQYGSGCYRLISLTDFSENNYLALYPDVAEAVRNGTVASGYEHFLSAGSKEGRELPCFSETDYRSRYPDVAEAVKRGLFKNGYEHYLLQGKAEGRKAFPTDSFSEAEYLLLYPDVKEGVDQGEFSSGYDHFLSVGQSQGGKASLQSGAFLKLRMDKAKLVKTADFLVFDLKFGRPPGQNALRLEIRWVTGKGDFSVPVCMFVHSGTQVIPLSHQSNWYEADHLRVDITGLRTGESLCIGEMKLFQSK